MPSSRRATWQGVRDGASIGLLMVLIAAFLVVPPELVDAQKRKQAERVCHPHRGVARLDLQAEPVAYRCRDGFEGVLR